MPRKRKDDTVSTDTVDVTEVADVDATDDDGTSGKDYSVYPREIRADHKRLDKATFSLERLQNRLNRAEAALEKAREVIEAKARPLQETIIRSQLAIDFHAENEAKVQQALAELNAPETVDA